MPLKRVTKTIPLTGGQQDEAPEFLLEPPGMAYTENARFRKQDSSEKTEPQTYIGATGNSHELDPFILHEHEGTLVTVGNNLSVYDGTDWRQTVLDAAPLGLERALSTAGEAGGSNYSWAPISVYAASTPVDAWTHYGYCVAFERRAQLGQETVVTVIVQRYDLSGVFVDETEMVSSGDGLEFGPVVQPVAEHSGEPTCRIYYMGWDGATYRLYTAYATSDFSTPIADGNLVYAGIGGPGHQAEYVETWGYPTDVEFETRRIGFTANALMHSTFKWKQPIGKGYGAAAWQTVSGDVKIQNTDSFGLPVGGVSTRYSSTGASNAYTLLDVDVDDTYIYILVAKYDTTDTSGDVDVILQRIEKTGLSSNLSKILVTAYAGTCPQGTVKLSAQGIAIYAYTLVGGNIDKRHDNEDDKLVWGNLLSDFSTVTVTGQLRNHRIASNIEIDKDGFPIVVVQQFGNFTPWARSDFTIPDTAALANTYADIKPVTSVLVRFLNAGRYTVIGSFDAGQSKDKDASYAEVNTAYGNLYYVDSLQDGRGGYWLHSHWYGNRNILTAEDYSCSLLGTRSPSTTTSDAMFSLLVGESKCNIYRVASDLPISGTPIGDGFILNSAVPLWYSGGAISEMSVLDQPEIIAVTPLEGDSTNLRAICYNATIDPIGYKVFQVVTGYFDHAGQVHRSAPSVPLFISSLDADEGLADPITGVRIFITSPLTASVVGGQYFAEAYSADVGEEPQLASVTHFDAGDHTDSVWLQAQTSLNPSASSWDLDTVRQSEFLYTTGNVLPVDSWPNIKHTTTTSRRMFATSIAAPGVIFYSKLFEEGIAPEFSASLVISLGASKDITALGNVDDKVLIFEKDAMHMLYGAGPDNTGANGDFIVEKVQSPLGCEDQESLVNTPDGLMFYSSVTQEFHLMSRDLQIIDIGKPVLDMSEGVDILSSVLYPEADEVRFYVSGSGSSDWGEDPDTGADIPDRPPRPRYGRSLPTYPVLVYNYRYQKWSVLTDQNVTAATLYENKPAMLSPNWWLSRITDTWADARYMKWETPWIKVNQLQDYGRFWEATLLGKYLSDWKDNGDGHEAGDLKVTVKYDYEGMNGDTDEFEFKANVDFDPSDGERLQFKVFPGRQKCQAIKFIIEEQATTKIDDSEPDYTLGRGFELTSIDLVYGAKGGSSRNFGTRRQK